MPPSQRRARLTALTASLTLIAALIGLAPTAAAQESLPDTAAAAQRAIERSLTETGATSISAALTDVDGDLWHGVAGVIDASGAAPGPTTRYGIGSVSKMFATTAVMQLVDAGLVELDKPVVQYLPSFTMASPQYRQITVRMLLNHSAGLPGSTYTNGFTTKPYAGYAQSVLTNLAVSSLKTTPGAMSVYCNDCFTVAGELVAAVTGTPFTTYVDNDILAPLGMTDSGYVTKNIPAPGTIARVVADGRTQPLEITNVYASGGLNSTPLNMMSFARMLLNGGASGGAEVLSRESVTEMDRSQMATTLNPAPDVQWRFGLGWDSVRNLNLEAVGVRASFKGGDTADFHSSLIVAPEAGLAVFVAGAGQYNSGAAQAVGEEILFNALYERGDIAEIPGKVGDDQPAPAAPTQADINAMLGIYLGTPNVSMRLSRAEGDTLRLDTLVDGAWSLGNSTLSFREDGKWWVDAPRAMAFSSVKGWGRAYLVYTRPVGFGNVLGADILGQRVAPAAPVAKEWLGRLGEWMLVSELPISTVWLGTPRTQLRTLPDLSGYLLLDNLSPIDARRADIGSMFLQIPLVTGRDLADLIPISANRMRMGSDVFVSRSSLPSLRIGQSRIEVGAEAYTEWRRANRARVVNIRGTQTWFVYNRNVQLRAHGDGSATGVRVPAGGLLMVAANAGDVVRVSAERG